MARLIPIFLLTPFLATSALAKELDLGSMGKAMTELAKAHEGDLELAVILDSGKSSSHNACVPRPAIGAMAAPLIVAIRERVRTGELTVNQPLKVGSGTMELSKAVVAVMKDRSRPALGALLAAAGPKAIAEELKRFGFLQTTKTSDGWTSTLQDAGRALSILMAPAPPPKGWPGALLPTGEKKPLAPYLSGGVTVTAIHKAPVGKGRLVTLRLASKGGKSKLGVYLTVLETTPLGADARKDVLKRVMRAVGAVAAQLD